MRILLAADQYPEYHNGAGAFTERLARGLLARGHIATVVYPSADGPRSATNRHGVRDVRVTSLRLPLGRGLRVCTPASARRVAHSMLTANPVDVVHVGSHLAVGRAFLSAAAERGIPTVATNHFMPENLLPHLPVGDSARTRIGSWAWRDLAQTYAQSDALTTPTERAAELLAERTGLDEIEVISNGVDLACFAPRQHPPSDLADDPYVLFVGRLEEEKRVEDLLSAFAALPAGLRARLVYIGTGSRLPALRHLAQTSGVADRVEFWGNVTEDRLRRAYTDCAVFCAPGIAELQSLVTLEAVASGAPVIAADAVALPHLVHHARNGFRYPPQQPALLTEHLVTLLADPVLRAQMSTQSRLIAKAHDFERTLDAYQSCYERVLASARAPLPAWEPALAA